MTVYMYILLKGQGFLEYFYANKIARKKSQADTCTINIKRKQLHNAQLISLSMPKILYNPVGFKFYRYGIEKS